MPKLKQMTWEEIRKCAEDGATALLPLGSLEQHGPHLPVRTDTGLVESIAETVLEDLDGKIPLVLAPTLWLGASNHHQAFFALSLGESTYIEVLVEMMRSFQRSGFNRLFVLNGHGGNSSPLRVALSRIRQEDISMLVGVAEYWSVAAPAIRRVRRSASGGAAHAGEIETSLMLHLYPDSVRTAKTSTTIPALPEDFRIDLLDSGSVALSLGWESLSANGQIGDGRAASAENGALFFQEITAAVSTVLATFHGLGAEI